MDKVTGHKIKYFPDNVDTKDKMLDENGRAIERIDYPEKNEAVMYDYLEGNYWTRELDGQSVYYLKEKVAYRDGVKHGKYCGYEITPVGGPSIDFFSRLTCEGHYINGKKVGRWLYYNKDGSVNVKMFVNDKDVTDSFGKDKGKSVMDIYKLQQIERSK